ncbi:hypothetical protein [Bacillus solitudinis]|uniref:hypothetical protein n=1 Tax=Bacillus solitudinis TaxID=2014074 RepID=UPI000C230F9F|nr:hypothetical protein [Bacillus solitudinis]
MSRINRTSRMSSLRANRIYSNFVNNLSHNQAIDKVEPVEPIDQMKTPSQQSSENYLLSYDLYYDKLKELKHEFKNFYHHEQALLEAIKSLDKNDALILNQTNKLVQKYNQAILAVIDFDKISSTSYVQNVRSVFHSFSDSFAEIGVFEEDTGLLKFSPDVFISYLKHTEDAGSKLMGTFKKMILKEYQSFMNIRIPSQDLNPYEQAPLPITGLVIEEEG